jgi:hypothetical protein
MRWTYVVTLFTAASMLLLTAAIAPIDDQTVREPLPPSRLKVEDQQGFTNDSLLIRFSVDSPSEHEFVMVEGLAAGTRLSAGVSAGPSRWQLPSFDLNQVNRVWVYPPTDFIGVMYVVIDLLSPDQRFVDSSAVRLRWLAKKSESLQTGAHTNSDILTTATIQPTEHNGADSIKNSDPSLPGETDGSGVASTATVQPIDRDRTAAIKKTESSSGGERIDLDHSIAPIIQPPDRDETAAIGKIDPSRSGESIDPDHSIGPISQPLDRDETNTILMKRGLELLKTGDVATARIAFQRLANVGIADGALALATTYDRRYLPVQVVGVFGDDKKARAWYRRAMELGSAEAGGILAEMVTK